MIAIGQTVTLEHPYTGKRVVGVVEIFTISQLTGNKADGLIVRIDHPGEEPEFVDCKFYDIEE